MDPFQNHPLGWSHGRIQNELFFCDSQSQIPTLDVVKLLDAGNSNSWMQQSLQQGSVGGGSLFFTYGQGGQQEFQLNFQSSLHFT